MVAEGVTTFSTLEFTVEAGREFDPDFLERKIRLKNMMVRDGRRYKGIQGASPPYITMEKRRVVLCNGLSC